MGEPSKGVSRAHLAEILRDGWKEIAAFFRERNWPDTRLGNSAAAIDGRIPEILAALSAAPPADELDAARWRKFNEVAKKHFNRGQGSIEFYLPRALGGFKSLEQTLDEDYAAVPAVAPEPAPLGYVLVELHRLNHLTQHIKALVEAGSADAKGLAADVAMLLGPN